MYLNITKEGAEPLLYTVKRWSRMGNGLTVTIAPPYSDELTRGAAYTVELEDEAGAAYTEKTVFQDFIFQGYVDEKGAAVVTVSDLVFNRPAT